MEVSYSIILVTCVISIFCLRDENLFHKLKFNAYDVKHSNQWYRFFSYGFLHANWLHLFVNMFVLLSFGEFVEKRFHMIFHEMYILYYLLLFIGALLISIIPAYAKHKNDVFYNSVGASGAVSAVVFASIILYPLGKISFFFIPIGIPSPLFGVFYLIYEWYMSRRADDNIGHDAHLWGSVFGILYPIALKPALANDFLVMLRMLFTS
jgi:membrane associated rhomboid family serine protease